MDGTATLSGGPGPRYRVSARGGGAIAVAAATATVPDDAQVGAVANIDGDTQEAREGADGESAMPSIPVP